MKYYYAEDYGTVYYKGLDDNGNIVLFGIPMSKDNTFNIDDNFIVDVEFCLKDDDNFTNLLARINNNLNK